METLDSAAILNCIALFRSQNICVCVFDMDLTAVAAHSRGCLLRSDLDAYLRQATLDFLVLVPDNTFRWSQIWRSCASCNSHTGRRACSCPIGISCCNADCQRLRRCRCIQSRLRKTVNPNDLIKHYQMWQILWHFDSVLPHQVVFDDGIEETLRVWDCCD